MERDKSKTFPNTKKRGEYQRPRGGPARAISELVPQIGRQAFRRFGFVQSSVVTRWPEIVGAQHARISRPESIRFGQGQRANGILELVVASGFAPLIDQIVPEIILRVNRFFGYNAVSRIKIRQGIVHNPEVKTPISAPPKLKPAPIVLSESLRDIGDPELRQVLEGLANSMSKAQ